MATLNITFNGMSQDVPLDVASDITDADVQRIAVEVMGEKGVVTAPDMFQNFVVDRMQDGQRIYLRPKVPFGA